MEIYILIDNQPQGPYEPGDVRKYLETGQLQLTDLGAYAGSSDWKPLHIMAQSWTGADQAAARPSSKASKKSTLGLVAGAVVLIALLTTGAVLTIHAHRQPDIQPKANHPEVAVQAVLEGEKDYPHAGPNDLQGQWKGMMQTQKRKLHVLFDIVQLPDGSLSAALESLDQGGGRIPATAIEYIPPNVSIEWKKLGAVFKGNLNDGKLTGTLQQGSGTPRPLNLSRD